LRRAGLPASLSRYRCFADRDGKQTAQVPKRKKDLTRRKVVVGVGAVAAVGIGGGLVLTASADEPATEASASGSKNTAERCAPT